jgi:hypothetical protein
MSYFVTTDDGTTFGAIVRTNTERTAVAEFYIFPIKNDRTGFYRNSIGRIHGRDACAITLRNWWAEKNSHTTAPVPQNSAHHTRRRRAGKAA